ncbi:uncharacterized protein [Centruroides vittatus]|uniref:uncharacterized protein n=1 Tax=Centruroides vittatus TaxID=120091 RepID=UPI00350F553F
MAFYLWMIPAALSVGLLILERFKELAKQLKLTRNRCAKYDVDEIIWKHAEIYDLINQMNDKWKDLFFLIFGIAIYILAFQIYHSIFVELDIIFRLLLCLGTIFSVFCGFLFSFAVSRISAFAYDSFQEIRIFASARLAIEDKIKLLDFMKKFRENELGFSCGGFFVASKGCPVKVYSSLYSAFNILLQVRDILKGGDNKCISFAAHILNLSQNSTLLQK